MRVYLAKAVGGTYTSVQGLRGQVDALEAELGVKLFSRTNKGLNPTVTGELFVRDVPQLVKLMARFDVTSRRPSTGARSFRSRSGRARSSPRSPHL